MAESTTVEGSTTLTAPEPAAPTPPEATLFPTGNPTPTSTPDAAAVVVPPVVPPVPPVAPTEPQTPKEPAAEAAKPAPTPTPAEYDLKLPEGSLLSEEDRVQTLKEAKDAGYPKETAEALIKAKDQSVKTFKTRQDQAFEQTKAQWKETIEKDTEIGGERLAETALLASRAFKAVASPELQVWAEKTGLGNYPELVRMMVKVGRLIGEDKLITGTVGQAPAKKPREEILYGKTTPNK